MPNSSSSCAAGATTFFAGVGAAPAGLFRSLIVPRSLTVPLGCLGGFFRVSLGEALRPLGDEPTSFPLALLGDVLTGLDKRRLSTESELPSRPFLLRLATVLVPSSPFMSS